MPASVPASFTLTYTATDAAGNSGTCSFVVEVFDVTGPVISGCPLSINQTTDTNKSFAVVTWTAPTASDAVDGAIATPNPQTSPVQNLNSGSQFGTQNAITVSYTFTDSSSRSSTCTFVVTVRGRCICEDFACVRLFLIVCFAQMPKLRICSPVLQA